MARPGCTAGSAAGSLWPLAAASTSGYVPGAGPQGACAVRDADSRPEARSYQRTASWPEAGTAAGTPAGAGTAARAGAAPRAETAAGAGVLAREPWSRDPRAARLGAAAGAHRVCHAQAAPRSLATGPACVRQLARRVPVDVIRIPHRSSPLGRDAWPPGPVTVATAQHTAMSARPLPGNRMIPRSTRVRRIFHHISGNKLLFFLRSRSIGELSAQGADEPGRPRTALPPWCLRLRGQLPRAVRSGQAGGGDELGLAGFQGPVEPRRPPERQQILGGNARRLLHLETAVAEHS